MESYERIDARGVRETGRPVSFVPKGALTHHPRSGRWYCLRQPCALRGGCGSCGSLMANATPLQRCCHWPRSRLIVSLHSKTVVSVLETTRRLPVKNINLMFFTAMGIAFSAIPIFFLRKRNKNENERTVRTNGDLPLGSQGGQQRNRAFCRGSLCLSELHQHPQ